MSMSKHESIVQYIKVSLMIIGLVVVSNLLIKLNILIDVLSK